MSLFDILRGVRPDRRPTVAGPIEPVPSQEYDGVNRPMSGKAPKLSALLSHNPAAARARANAEPERIQTTVSPPRDREEDAEVMDAVYAADDLNSPGIPDEDMTDAPDLSAAVSAQLGPKITRTVRNHGPRQGKPIIVISGDGSPEGTHIMFEGSQAPGPVMAYTAVQDMTRTDRNVAAGAVRCSTEAHPDGEWIDVWVRFGEHRSASTPVTNRLRSNEPTGS